MTTEVETLTWDEVVEQVKKDRRILIPLGSFEQHGRHLPLATDSILATNICKAVASRMDIPVGPTLSLGFSPEHADFPGTISLEPNTFISLLKDCCASLTRHGFSKIFLINGHGGNRAPAETAIQWLKDDLDASLYLFNILDILQEKFREIRSSSKGDIGHADEIETSMMLYVAPSAVRKSKISYRPPNLPSNLSLESEDVGRVVFAWRASELSKDGVIGNPKKASAKKGEILVEFVIGKISELIAKL